MPNWREQLEEKRKRQERQRALLKSLASGEKPAIETGAAFVARKKQEKEGQGEMFSDRSPAERLLDVLLDAERRETPKGPCLVRTLEIPVDPDAPAGPIDFSSLDSSPGTDSQPPAAPGTPGATTVRPTAPANALRRPRRSSSRPIDYSDVWPEDLPPRAGKIAEDPSSFSPTGDSPDHYDEPPPEPDPYDWTTPQDIPPPDPDHLLEDIPRFRRGLERARRNRKKTEMETPEDPFERFPPIEYQCRPGFPCSVAVPSLLNRLAQDKEPESEIGLEDILFLDTETTGLAGGTGTFPFLTGVGFFKNLDTDRPVFVVEQYFMEDFCCEEALLYLVAERLAQFTALCTYNGKTFDVPLLRTRYIFNRRQPSDWDRPHIDLLHASRRLWRGVLPSVSLGTVERAVLGLRRERDIDGALIPKMYFQFTRGVRPEQMVPVFDHNVQDIASLGALLLRLCGYFQNPDHPALTIAGELTGLALWLHRQGREDEAIRCFNRAVAASTDADEQDRLLTHLARIHKRAGRWEEAIDIWTRLLDRPIGPALAAAVELAKYWEHREKNPARAGEIVASAITRLQADQEARALLGGPDPPDLRKSPSQWIEELEHRLTRLERRAEKAKPPRGKKISPE